MAESREWRNTTRTRGSRPGGEISRISTKHTLCPLQVRCHFVEHNLLQPSQVSPILAKWPTLYQTRPSLVEGRPKLTRIWPALANSWPNLGQLGQTAFRKLARNLFLAELGHISARLPLGGAQWRLSCFVFRRPPRTHFVGSCFCTPSFPPFPWLCRFDDILDSVQIWSILWPAGEDQCSVCFGYFVTASAALGGSSGRATLDELDDCCLELSAATLRNYRCLQRLGALRGRLGGRFVSNLGCRYRVMGRVVPTWPLESRIWMGIESVGVITNIIVVIMSSIAAWSTLYDSLLNQRS